MFAVVNHGGISMAERAAGTLKLREKRLAPAGQRVPVDAEAVRLKLAPLRNLSQVQSHHHAVAVALAKHQATAKPRKKGVLPEPVMA